MNLAFSTGCRGVVSCSPAQAAGGASGWDEAASKKEIRGGSSEGGERMCVYVYWGGIATGTNQSMLKGRHVWVGKTSVENWDKEASSL